MKKFVNYFIIAVVALAATACQTELDKDKFSYNLRYLAVSEVKLNKETTTLSWNAKETLEATVFPDKADNKDISWSSNNPDVASVNFLGEITAMDVGTATITVTTDDGSKVASCVVTVNPFVELDESALELLVGDKFTLKATVFPSHYSQTVVWSSTTEATASVSATGEVTALADGSTTIRATIPNADPDAPVIRAQTAVSVGLVPVEKVELDAALSPILIGQEVILTATVYPPNAANQDVEWRVKSNVLVLTPDPNDQYVVTVRRIAEGDAAVTVVTVDGGHEATCLFESDPHLVFTGGDGSKVWTWDKFEWGPLSGTPWWSVPDWNDLLVNTYKSKDGIGATMTFSSTGRTMVKEKTDGTKEEGTFSVDMTKTKVRWDWEQKPVPANIWSIGQLTTEGVTILWGRFLDHDTKIEDSDKKPNPGEYPNGEEDVEPINVLDIIKLEDDEIVLAIPGMGPGIDAEMHDWSGAWYWTFKPKE